MKNLKKYLIYFIAINLIILGADKFLGLIPMGCTLMTDASNNMLYGIGIVEIALGILLFLGKATKIILSLVVLFMVWAIGMHLINETYDIGGAVFLAVAAMVPVFIKDNEIVS